MVSPSYNSSSLQTGISDARSKKPFYSFQTKLILIFTLGVAFIVIYLDNATKQLSLSSNQLSTEYVRKTSNNQRSADSSNGTIKSISILGERNSGTTWMYEHLGECFNHSVPVLRRLTRYKHWFQDDKIGVPVNSGTLVLAMFRNPFEWTEAMRKIPHHASNHLFLDWKEFVTRPWTMERVGLDLSVTESQKADQHFCQEDFLYRDIISCHKAPYPIGYFQRTRYSNHQPFYEMKNDGSGEPYESILDMRTAKIKNMMEVKNYSGVEEFWILRYEDVVMEGTKKLISKIEELTGVKSRCIPSESQNRRHRPLENEMIDYIMKHLDWSAESMIGYSRPSEENSTY